MSKKKFLFLFSDTGGGHRSSCEAVEEALNHIYPNQFIVDKVDFLKNYGAWPFNLSADLYPHMVRFQSYPWELMFNLSNKPKTFEHIANFFWSRVKPKLTKLFLDHPADLIVSFHPLINYYLDLLGLNTKSVVVITDLITAHIAWYSGHPLKYFVPTEEIKNTGISLKFPAENIIVTGLPISLRFHPKRKLEDHKSLRTVLLMGGGQGMGKIFTIAESLNSSKLNINLIIVAGRNSKLEQKLKTLNWYIPVEIFGFTQNVPELMQRSDVLLTKAGPSTIYEGLVTGIPIILYDFLKGQESSSVDYLVKNNAGFYCPTSKSIIQTLSNMPLYPPPKIAKPHAAIDIANRLKNLI